MADNPSSHLHYRDGCPDCAERYVQLPQALPAAGDDFDWLQRDYDGFRLFMLQELAARFPERQRWTPADVEVALVEALAYLLDQLSDQLDRMSAETTLTTARRPDSVRGLLNLIGYDPLSIAKQLSQPPFHQPAVLGDTRTDEQRFDQHWLNNPHQQEAAKREGIRAIHQQRRLVTLQDYIHRLQEHPLVSRATAWSDWSGSWYSVRVAIIGLEGFTLDATGIDFSRYREALDRYHAEGLLPALDWDHSQYFTLRSLLRHVIDQWRMLGQEVILQDAEPIGVMMSLSVQVADHYFQTEVRQAIQHRLSRNSGGFFEPGRLQFGEDLHASDIFQWVMSLDGVRNVCLNRFKRVGSQFADQSGDGLIALSELQMAVCDNNRQYPEKGYYYLTLHGGRQG